MSDPQFDVERATAGLVLALFLAASLLVGAMYYFVLRDMEERADASDASQAVRVERPSAGPPPASAPILASEHHA
jgi:sensor domain CHASE-containing protein